jgi:hypothetical protein
MRALLGTGVAFLVGGALGYLVAGEGRRAPQAVAASAPAVAERVPRPAPALPSEASLADRALLLDLLQEVRDLKRLVQLFAETPDDGSRVPLDTTVPPPDGKKEAELRAWMSRIEEGLGNLAKSPGSFPLIDLPPEGLRPTPLPVPSPDDEDQEVFGSSHLLWSYQDVLEAYGRPDVVHDGNEWEYRYVGELPAESELSDVHFSFSNGFCTSMYAH